MSPREQRPVIAFLGACLLWGAIGLGLLFAAAAVWLLVQGEQPSWVLLAVVVIAGAGGYGLIRLSRVPLGDAMNTWS
ncbi:hypothetical protein [Rothia halotolerans]|uniref:hypothetical protein n=1 Tax=Rothia halotolerans TaxID=405770 RepID=UPI00101C3C2E|nr:hypothetical protein [Rothia halotolerans]